MKFDSGMDNGILYHIPKADPDLIQKTYFITIYIKNGGALTFWPTVSLMLEVEIPNKHHHVAKTIPHLEYVNGFDLSLILEELDPEKKTPLWKMCFL